MERVRHPIRGHRLAGGAQRLRRNLPAVKREAAGLGPVGLAAEQIAVERLEVEEGGEILPAHRRILVAAPRRATTQSWSPGKTSVSDLCHTGLSPAVSTLKP